MLVCVGGGLQNSRCASEVSHVVCALLRSESFKSPFNNIVFSKPDLLAFLLLVILKIVNF